LQNIKKEAEATSKKIPAEYLDKINSGYLDYIKSQTDLNVLIIDVSIGFVKIKKIIFYFRCNSKKIE
jgi:hypothetical protein